MLKEILEQVKKKAIEDDNKYWERQEEWIQRKSVTWNDVPFYQYFLMWSIAGLTWALINAFIF